MTLGSAIGVYVAGDSGFDDPETGSFPATLAGSILGSAVGFGLITASGLITDEFGKRLFWHSLCATIGATIGFNMTRRYKPSPALDSQMTPAAPQIYFNLVRVRF